MTAVVTAAIVGGATYITVNNQAKSDKAALQTTVDSLSAQIVALNSKITSPPASSSTDFLVIKELGIKLPLTSSIKDLIYTYKSITTGAVTSPGYIHFSTNSIKNIPNNTYTCSADRDPLGGYTFYTTRQSNEGVGDNQAGTLEVTVNGYYIYYHHTQYACGDTSQDQAKVAALITPVLTAVQQAQAN